MTRARIGSWILGVLALFALGSRPISAIGPAAIVLHGGALTTPVVIHPPIGSFMFMWGAGTGLYDNRSANAIPSGLEGRRYLDYDVFWGAFTADELKPEAASQHGRLYLPTGDQPAAVVLTPPAMTGSEPGATRAAPTAIPDQLNGFASGRGLQPVEVAALAAAGVPMK